MQYMAEQKTKGKVSCELGYELGYELGCHLGWLMDNMLCFEIGHVRSHLSFLIGSIPLYIVLVWFGLSLSSLFS